MNADIPLWSRKTNKMTDWKALTKQCNNEGEMLKTFPQT